MTLIDELKQAIMATKGKFAADDFYHITTARVAHRSAVSKAFRLLRGDFCIKVSGHRGSEGSKRDLVCYEVVEGVKFAAKERKELKPRKIKEVAEKVKFHPNDHWWTKVAAHPVMMAQNNLDAAMSGWI